jgi:ubiquinone biosynthesis protein COQ4
MKTVFRAILASFFIITGAIILIFNRNNYKPIYRGLRYFLDHESYQLALKILMNDPATKSLIDSRYRQDEQTDWTRLKSLPEDTLGYQFAKFMNMPEITPINKLPENKVEISPEIDYLRQRIRLIHDIHHVVCDYPATEIGEMAISAFYVAQINSPLNSMLLAFGLIKCTIKMPSKLPELMNAITHGWQTGLKTPNLFGVKWEELYELPINDVRRQLNIQVV